jgi:hypothetical protein
MRLLKAKYPVNASRLGPDMPLTENTVHKQLYMESLQKDGTQSKMIITINEDYRDVLWMGVNVDGKFHVIELHLKELINTVTELSSGAACV